MMDDKTQLETPHMPQWNPSDTRHDTNLIYGLNLPTHVRDTTNSRSLGIHNMRIVDVRLWQVLSKKLDNFAFRSTAHRRYTCYEGLRAKNEALITGELVRLLRSDKNSRLIDTALLRKSRDLDLDPNQFIDRVKIATHIVQKIIDALASKYEYTPDAANEEVQRQLIALQHENTNLKRARDSIPLQRRYTAISHIKIREPINDPQTLVRITVQAIVPTVTRRDTHSRATSEHIDNNAHSQ